MNEIKFAHQIESAISGNSLLGLLGTAERKELAAQSSVFAISKNEALYRTGDAADCAWAVVSGQIKVVKQSHSGHRLLIEIITPGEICGGICYSDDACFAFSAFAMDKTVALRFPVHAFRRSADAKPALLCALLKDMCHRLYQAQHMRSLSIEDVAGRVACALVYLQRQIR